MKALDILRWCSWMGQPSEYFQVVSIDETFDFKSFFGYDYKVTEYGNYFYYWTDCIDKSEIAAPIDNMYFHLSEPVKPTFSIDTGNLDTYGETIFIHFYKIED